MARTAIHQKFEDISQATDRVGEHITTVKDQLDGLEKGLDTQFLNLGGKLSVAATQVSTSVTSVGTQLTELGTELNNKLDPLKAISAIERELPSLGQQIGLQFASISNQLQAIHKTLSRLAREDALVVSVEMMDTILDFLCTLEHLCRNNRAELQAINQAINSVIKKSAFEDTCSTLERVALAGKHRQLFRPFSKADTHERTERISEISQFRAALHQQIVVR
jgi:uncharacterized phage infection (PIP) family protein YhgE